MRITHLRNATFLLEIAEDKILVDPMLGDAGSLPAFRVKGEKRRNPLVELPNNAMQCFAAAEQLLLTHEHPDHFDKPALQFFREHRTPCWVSPYDRFNLKRKGLNVVDLPDDSNGLTIEVIPAKHGHGLMGWIMGPVAGYYLRHPEHPSVYITGDTVYSGPVKEALQQLRPDVVIAPAGTANFGFGKDLMFSQDELLQMVQDSEATFVFNHLEAIDHCPLTRKKLMDMMREIGAGDRVLVPEDGESLEIQPADFRSVPARPSKAGHRRLQKLATALLTGT